MPRFNVHSFVCGKQSDFSRSAITMPISLLRGGEMPLSGNDQHDKAGGSSALQAELAGGGKSTKDFLHLPGGGSQKTTKDHCNMLDSI